MSEPVDVAMIDADGSLALELQGGAANELAPSATVVALMAAAALLHMRVH